MDQELNSEMYVLNNMLFVGRFCWVFRGYHAVQVLTIKTRRKMTLTYKLKAPGPTFRVDQKVRHFWHTIWNDFPLTKPTAMTTKPKQLEEPVYKTKRVCNYQMTRVLPVAMRHVNGGARCRAHLHRVHVTNFSFGS